jgi:hypothetical protein
MAIHIDANGRLNHDHAASFALVCPQCATYAHVTPMAVPAWSVLEATKPAHVGIVFACDACHAPVFLKFSVRLYGRQRVELSPHFQEIERPRERLDTEYLPEGLEALCHEALTVFAADCWNAFALLCRRIVQEVAADWGDHGRLKLFDLLNDWREMADVDPETFNRLRRVLLLGDAPAPHASPTMDGQTAGILLEALKDVLYQTYTRRGRVQQALLSRRRPSPAEPPANVTVLARSQS